MKDETQVLRQQLEETKLQLFEKLYVLENQIAETIETTGTAVKSTVGIVEHVMEAVTNTFDARGQFERHPLLIMGGAIAGGYLLAGLGNKKGKSSHVDSSAGGVRPIADFSIDPTDVSAESTAQLAAVSAAYELGSKQSTANQARTLAVNATIRIVEEIVSRSVPMMIEYFTSKPASPKPRADSNQSRNSDMKA